MKVDGFGDGDSDCVGGKTKNGDGDGDGPGVGGADEGDSGETRADWVIGTGMGMVMGPGRDPGMWEILVQRYDQ